MKRIRYIKENNFKVSKRNIRIKNGRLVKIYIKDDNTFQITSANNKKTVIATGKGFNSHNVKMKIKEMLLMLGANFDCERRERTKDILLKIKKDLEME